MAEQRSTGRRTQAERREASRTALLDAAVASLAEDGYAQLTTRDIARRAGVSQGAWVHYFPSKSIFLAEATKHAASRLTTGPMTNLDLGSLATSSQAREDLLDLVWTLHATTEFRAALELWVAARTDSSLRAGLRGLDEQLNNLVESLAKGILPPSTLSDDQLLDDEPQADHQLLELLDMTLAAIRGYALLPPVTPQSSADRRWLSAKRVLLAAYDDYFQTKSTANLGKFDISHYQVTFRT